MHYFLANRLLVYAKGAEPWISHIIVTPKLLPESRKPQVLIFWVQRFDFYCVDGADMSQHGDGDCPRSSRAD
jgi:hypothetical protein